MKHLNLQRAFHIPENIKYIASNFDGAVVGFENAPIRDYELKIWIDASTGDHGEVIPFDRWETSVHLVSDLQDLRGFYGKRQAQINNRIKHYKEEPDSTRPDPGLKTGTGARKDLYE